MIELMSAKKLRIMLALVSSYYFELKQTSNDGIKIIHS